MEAVLNLQLTVDERHVVEAAKALQQRLPPSQWKVLVQMAAEIVARHEAVTTGQRVLVVPARPEEVAEVARAAGFQVAGAD